MAIVILIVLVVFCTMILISKGYAILFMPSAIIAVIGFLIGRKTGSTKAKVILYVLAVVFAILAIIGWASASDTLM